MILVTGATGQVGGHLVSQLCLAGAPTRALVSSPERAETLQGYDCDVVIGSFGDRGSLAAALAGATKVFLVSPPGPDQPAQEGAVIEAVQETGTAPHVVKIAIAAFGADTGCRIHRQHAQIVDRLTAAETPYTVLAPTPYMQDLLSAAATVQEQDALDSAAGDARISFVDAADVAAVAAHVLTSTGHEGATYTITGPDAVTYDEVADTLGRILGRRIRYRPVSAEEAKAGMLASGASPWLADAQVELDESHRAGHSQLVTDEVAKATGRPARSVEDFLRGHRAAFG